MDIERVVSIMNGLGFSPYEAKAYAALVQEHPLTGYELSGISGIPRSKIYECIERLCRKKLIVTVEGSPARYVPVPPDELVRRLSNEFDSSVKSLGILLNETKENDPVDYIFNISGYGEIISKAIEMIQGTHHHLDISIWNDELEKLLPYLKNVSQHVVKIQLLLFTCPPLNSCPPFHYGRRDGRRDGYDIDLSAVSHLSRRSLSEGGWKAGCVETYHHRPLTESEFTGRWISVVKDRSEVLTGQCSGEGGIIAAWTRNRCIVFVSLKYIEHEIIKIKEQS